MKSKILRTVSIIMLFVPWTILPLRQFPWALKSPTAEIMISCYAAFMILGGAFTILAYVTGRVRDNLMKICLVIHCLYAVFGGAIFGIMLFTKIF